jgi:hypothetical protein
MIATAVWAQKPSGWRSIRSWKDGQSQSHSLRLQIPQHAGPGFHVMPGRYSTASRASIP